MRASRTIIVLAVAAFCLLSGSQVQAWRGGGGFGGFRGDGFGGGGFGGFRGGDFGGGDRFGGFRDEGFGGGGFSGFHPSGFGGGFGSVHNSGFGGDGFGSGFGHEGRDGQAGLGGDYSGRGVLPGAGYGRSGVGGQAGLGGGLAGSAGVGRGEVGTEYNKAASYYSDHHNYGYTNYGSIQHYGLNSNLNVYHGPAGGTAATYDSRYVSGAAVKGPAGYGAAAVKGPEGGYAAGYRGPYSSGAVAHLPSGYTTATWHGMTYYHSGYVFYQPTWYCGTVSYVPVYPPVGFFFASLPPAATTTVVNNNTYYVSSGVYYQPATQNGQQGYSVVAAPAQGQSPQPAPSAAAGGPDPFSSLQKMSDYLGKEKHIKMTISETYDQVALAGQKIKLWSERKIQIKRPDRMVVEVSGTGFQRRITCDGEDFTIVDLLKNVYATMPMQGSLDDLMDRLARQYGMAQPVEDLLYSDINARLVPRIQTGQFIGSEQVDEHKCNHFAFKQADMSWQVWIEEGHKPVPWKLAVSYDSAPGRPQYVLQITKFETPIFMMDSEFKAKVPDGAVSASLTSLISPTGGSQ